jgi:hypothetical protein
MANRGWRAAEAIVGLLVLTACVVVLVLTLREAGLQDAANAAAVLAVVLALPALAIPLVRRLRAETAPTADQVSRAGETLAGLVTGQWRQEALARSLGNPEPMPVRWRLTEHSVMDHPRLIMAGLSSFDGRSDRISPLAAEFRQLLRRRLVILGGPGSGKTTLAVQLLLELLTTRRSSEPIPVLLSLATWNPVEQPRLHRWLADRLAEGYPSLLAFGPAVARALAEQGKILPILDGLDELPAPRRSTVIAALNASLTETDHLVLTSRTQEFDTAVAEASEVLTAAAVIEPEPLGPPEAADYLAACLPPDPGPSWQKVLDRLREGTAGHLATVLSTPLGLWLLRTVYIAPSADPAALLNSAAMRDPTTMQADLFDQLIPAVLAARPASRNPADTFRPRRTWKPHQVRNWLTYLAQHLHHADTQDLRWWHLARHSLAARPLRLVVGLVVGLVIGVVFLLGGLLGGGLVLALWRQQGTGGGLVTGMGGGLNVNQWLELLFGVVAGLVAGLVGGLRGDRMAEGWLIDEPAYANLQFKHRINLLARQLAIGMVGGLGGGLWLGLAGGGEIGLMSGLRLGLDSGLLFGLLFGLMFGVVAWLGVPSKRDWVTTPRSTYGPTRSLSILQLFGIGLVVGPIGGFLGALVLWPWLWPWFGLWFESWFDPWFELTGGLLSGLAFGLMSLSSGAWLVYILASCRLAASRKLPLRLMDFLDDAYRLGLLRTTGPAYQFRHAEFRDHLLQTESG